MGFRLDKIRTLIWVGDSKKRLKEFPKQGQKDIGDALYLAQIGEHPPFAKPLKGIGGGGFEIVKPFDKETYRAVYAVRVGENLFVLHAFQKKSKKGIATPKPDIEIIKRRLKAVKDLEESDEKKRKV